MGMASNPRRMSLVGVALALLLPAAAIAQQPVTITGRVLSENNEPLRATVAIPEINVFTTAQEDGNYRLVVPAGKVLGQQVRLIARMIGRQLQIAPVRLVSGQAITHNFALRSDPLRLQEVVVTGAGTESVVEKLGTARTTVSGQDLLRANQPNIVTALAGKVPGVLTNQASGDAGASTAIQIRGPKSFGTSQPIFIVDGVPIGNNTRGGILSGAPAENRAADINPEDIESIEILKGAAATSIAAQTGVERNPSKICTLIRT